MILDRIENIECFGDKLHNKHIDKLFNGVNLKSKNAKKVLNVLHELLDATERRWIIDIIHLNDAAKLNAMMKSKTDKTFQKRVKNYINFLATATHYGAFFNKDFIVAFKKLED